MAPWRSPRSGCVALPILRLLAFTCVDDIPKRTLGHIRTTPCFLVADRSCTQVPGLEGSCDLRKSKIATIMLMISLLNYNCRLFTHLDCGNSRRTLDCDNSRRTKTVISKETLSARRAAEVLSHYCLLPRILQTYVKTNGEVRFPVVFPLE